MPSTTSATNVPILTTANYSLWAPAMEDYLQAKGMWYWIHHSAPNERTDPKGNRKCLESKDQWVKSDAISPQSSGVSPLALQIPNPSSMRSRPLMVPLALPQGTMRYRRSLL